MIEEIEIKRLAIMVAKAVLTIDETLSDADMGALTISTWKDIIFQVEKLGGDMSEFETD